MSARIVILCTDQPGVIKDIAIALYDAGANIESMHAETISNPAPVVVRVNNDNPEEIKSALAGIDGVVEVR